MAAENTTKEGSTKRQVERLIDTLSFFEVWNPSEVHTERKHVNLNAHIPQPVLLDSKYPGQSIMIEVPFILNRTYGLKIIIYDGTIIFNVRGGGHNEQLYRRREVAEYIYIYIYIHIFELRET